MQTKRLMKPAQVAFPALAATLAWVISSTASPTSVQAAVSSKPIHAPAQLSFDCKEANETDIQMMVATDSAFAYKTNAWRQPVARLIKLQCYAVVGRDEGEFVLFKYGDSQLWTSRTALRLRDNLDFTNIPLVDLKKISTVAAPLPMPRGVPTISVRMKQIYKQAAKAGRDPRGVSVAGDCNSEYPVFFGRLAAGATNLSLSPKLAKTYQHFSPSFTRWSVATQGSLTAQGAFDAAFVDPKTCQTDEGPLACELRVSRASIFIISLGTGDTFTWQNFEPNYRKAIETVLVANAVPVLMTKADALETREGGAAANYLNGVIRSLGAQYGVPVIDFALAAQSLPNGGLMIEPSPSGNNAEPFHLNQQGMDARILMTLQTLNAISGK
jgi:hypothetical protein